MNWFLSAAAISGFLSVAAGAAGNHFTSLDAQSHEMLETAVRYHQIYSVLLVSLCLYKHPVSLYRLWTLTRSLFLVGIVIFSGSLYALAFTNIPGYGYLTPAGGVILMAGWLSLVVYAAKNHKVPNIS